MEGNGGLLNVQGLCTFDRCSIWSTLFDVTMSVYVLFTEGSKVEVDPARTLRMGGFGFLLYGPMQHYWYTILGHQFPLRTASHFLTKVGTQHLPGLTKAQVGNSGFLPVCTKYHVPGVSAATAVLT
eukprot:evm.model.scf_181EXC.17 EVM.evm.TU.scf_181EXC.17   scf_181EXC:114496-114873(-)